MRHLLLFVVLVLGSAWAIPGHASDHPDQGSAYAHCEEQAAAQIQGENRRRSARTCEYQQATPTTGRYACMMERRSSSDQPWREDGCVGNSSMYHTFPLSAMCENRPDEYWWAPEPGMGDVCSQGCRYKYAIGIGIPSGYFPSGETCTNADAPEPRLDSDGDGIPDIEDAFPDDPYEWADSDGDGIGDNADFAKDDPTDGKDRSEEGEPNGERDNVAEGGGDCRAPPRCAGDGIQCNQLFQQWSIRCQDKVKLSGNPTVCSASFDCVGDTAQCAQILLARKTACSIGNGTGGGGEGGGQPDWTKGAEPGRGDDEDNITGVARFGINIKPDELLDREAIFGTGNCPVLPSFELMGFTINPADLPQWCTLVAVMRGVILLVGAVTALNILLGRNG